MTIKTAFAAIAVSLSHLSSAHANVLHDDQRKAIEEAVAHLRDAEENFDKLLDKAVSAAVNKRIADLDLVTRADHQAVIDDLSAQIAAQRDALEQLRTDVEDGLSGVKSAVDSLSEPTATPPGGAGDDTITAGGGADTVTGGAADDGPATPNAGAGDDAVDPITGAGAPDGSGSTPTSTDGSSGQGASDGGQSADSTTADGAGSQGADADAGSADKGAGDPEPAG